MWDLSLFESRHARSPTKKIRPTRVKFVDKFVCMTEKNRRRVKRSSQHFLSSSSAGQTRHNKEPITRSTSTSYSSTLCGTQPVWIRRLDILIVLCIKLETRTRGVMKHDRWEPTLSYMERPRVNLSPRHLACAPALPLAIYTVQMNV
jgi:hypothetical protein